eukprot:gnl/Chilomastix_cuspidata/6620.p2 GENE.gnl/Chilomastix_cuspidata/6620~~gnl/Chilomastix_cuspidata/6620.p2  ORF type:complete len:124 (-),score=23.77 gnl/Chilomastix_cuspidata/6620:97-468(-)
MAIAAAAWITSFTSLRRRLRRAAAIRFFVPDDANLELGTLGRTIANVCAELVCLICALWWPNIESILGLAGAIGGGIYIFLIPCLTHWVLSSKFRPQTWNIWKKVGIVLLLCYAVVIIVGQFL